MRSPTLPPVLLIQRRWRRRYWCHLRAKAAKRFRVRIIFNVSRATFLDNERQWTLLDLETDSVVWSIKQFCVYFLAPSSPTTKGLKASQNLAEKIRRVQRWLEHLLRFVYTVVYHTGFFNGTPNTSPVCLSGSPTKNITGPPALRAHRRRLPYPCLWLYVSQIPKPGVSLGGLVPTPRVPSWVALHWPTTKCSILFAPAAHDP